MKKIYIIIAAFIISMPLYALDITLRVPMSLSQTYKDSDGELEAGADTVYSYGFEVGQDLYLIQAGAAMQWDTGSSYAPDDGFEFQQRLTYGYVKFNLFPVVFRPYIVAKYGTIRIMNLEGYTHDDSEGETYTAFGLGIDILNLQGELLYSSHGLTLADEEFTQSMISLVVGVKIF